MTCYVVVGGFFGDEGKGKVISYLALKDKPSVVARGGCGTNAGHTVEYGGRRFKLRQIPSGFVYEGARVLIGAGVLVDPNVFLKEVEEAGVKGRVGVDYNCAIIEPRHIEQDRGSRHLSGKIGSTGTGCGPCNAERAMRTVRLARDVDELKEYLTDVSLELNEAVDRGENAIIEGTQGTFLSLYHGTYPYVTSKDTTASQACADVGIGPTKVDEVLVVFKAYVTRVGGGPLLGELSEEEAERRGWLEVATVTGRKRRAAPFNFELARRAVRLNGATQVAITKLDVVYPECQGATSFEELPRKAVEFVEEVESQLRRPVTIIGTGADANSVIDRREEI